MRTALTILALAIGLMVLAPSAAAQDGNVVECADFSPESVREACDRAVPIECRGQVFSDTEYEECLRAHGTTPEEVRTAIDAAYEAAGIPIGGVDTGLGGLARERPRSSQVLPGLIVLASLAAVALGIGARRHRAGA